MTCSLIPRSSRYLAIIRFRVKQDSLGIYSVPESFPYWILHILYSPKSPHPFQAQNTLASERKSPQAKNVTLVKQVKVPCTPLEDARGAQGQPLFALPLTAPGSFLSASVSREWFSFSLKCAVRSVPAHTDPTSAAIDWSYLQVNLYTSF